MNKTNNSKNLFMLTSSMLIFGSIGIFRRYIPVPSAYLALVRGILGSLFILAASALQKKKLLGHIEKKQLMILILSGAAIGFNWILLFEAYNFTTIATATLCYYMEPVIVVMLSPILFREKITARKGLCVLAAVVGAVCVSGIIENGMPTASEARGILCGLGAAALYASVVLMNKALTGIDAYLKTFVQLLAAGITMVPYLLITGQPLLVPVTVAEFVLIMIVGLVHTGFAYTMYFGSIEGLKAQTVALFSYIDPVTALIFSAIIFHEHMSIFGIIGAVLIIGSAAVSSLMD